MAWGELNRPRSDYIYTRRVGLGPESDLLYTRRGRFYLPVDRPIPTKSTGQVGLSARGSYSELRGKSVLGLGASQEAWHGAFPATAPTIYKAGNLEHFPLLECDFYHSTIDGV